MRTVKRLSSVLAVIRTEVRGEQLEEQIDRAFADAAELSADEVVERVKRIRRLFEQKKAHDGSR